MMANGDIDLTKSTPDYKARLPMPFRKVLSAQAKAQEDDATAALAIIKELVEALQPFVLATSDFDDSWSSADEIDLVFDELLNTAKKTHALKRKD
jgi:hypothetical protein